MSEKLDLVRSIYADWKRGEFGEAGRADPGIEFVFDGGPSPGTWTGLADIAEAMRDFIGAWSGFHIKAEDYRELDDERVLVLSTLGGSDKTSRLSLGHMRSEKCELFRIRSRKVVRLVIYWDRDRAHTDLGLAD